MRKRARDTPRVLRDARPRSPSDRVADSLPSRHGGGLGSRRRGAV